jgi:4-hydroxy-tetrahydrodipicolinate reductase
MGEIVEEQREPVEERQDFIEPEGPTRVAVVGAATPHGLEVFRSLSQWEQVDLVLAVDHNEIGRNLRELAGGRAANVVVEEKLGAALDRQPCDILLDFTHSSAALQHGISAMRRGITPILGTHLSAPEVRELVTESRETNVPALIVPNFSLAAVLLLRFCRDAASWLPEVEILDIQADHRNEQLSYMARGLAEEIAQGQEHRHIHPHGWVDTGKPRTWQEVETHKIRLKGHGTHQEVMFGAAGETIRLRYDFHDCTSILEGVKLAISQVRSLKGVVVGLEKLMFRS